MKVMFDHQIYATTAYGGIARYFYEISKNLISKYDVDVVNTTLLSDNVFTGDPIFNVLPFFPGKSFKGKKRFLKVINQISSEIQLKGQYDVFHPTYDDTYFLKAIKARPFVITIHDLIHEKFTGKYKELNDDASLFFKRRQLINQCSKIIAVSNNTKNDLIEHYNIAAAKIEVIYHGNAINDYFKAETIVPYNNYILYVGRRGLYKNFVQYIEAITPLLFKERDLIIICAGGGAFTENEISFFNNLKILNQLIQIDITDTLLAALYRKALFFVFPSLYEGFGIPILEAFSCSCPSLLSNTSSLSEIGGSAALYFDPYDKSEMLFKTQHLLYNDDLKEKLKLSGLLRASKFTWAKTAEGHYNLYGSLIA